MARHIQSSTTLPIECGQKLDSWSMSWVSRTFLYPTPSKLIKLSFVMTISWFSLMVCSFLSTKSIRYFSLGYYSSKATEPMCCWFYANGTWQVHQYKLFFDYWSYLLQWRGFMLCHESFMFIFYFLFVYLNMCLFIYYSFIYLFVYFDYISLILRECCIFSIDPFNWYNADHLLSVWYLVLGSRAQLWLSTAYRYRKLILNSQQFMLFALNTLFIEAI